MRKALSVISLCLLLLACLGSTIRVNVGNIVSGKVSNRKVTLTLTSTNQPAVVGPWIVPGDSVAVYTDTNGYAYFSNVLALGQYRIDVAGNPPRSFPISVPDTNQVYDVSQLIGTNVFPQVFYNAAQIDSMLANAGIIRAIYPLDTSIIVLTNGFAIGLSAVGGGSTNGINAIQATNIAAFQAYLATNGLPTAAFHPATDFYASSNPNGYQTAGQVTASIASASLSGNQITSGTVADARLTGNVTKQGNTFNGANQLVQLDANAALVALQSTALFGYRTNSLTDAGVVPPGNGLANRFYTTDGSGNPGWNTFTPGAPPFSGITSGENDSFVARVGTGGTLYPTNGGNITASTALAVNASAIVGGGVGGTVPQNALGTNTPLDGMVIVVTGPTFKYTTNLNYLWITNLLFGSAQSIGGNPMTAPQFSGTNSSVASGASYYFIMTYTNDWWYLIGTNGNGGFITNTVELGNGSTSNQFVLRNFGGQNVLATYTNGVLIAGTNRQMVLDPLGNLTIIGQFNGSGAGLTGVGAGNFAAVSAHTLLGNQNGGTAQPSFGFTWAALDDLGSSQSGFALRTPTGGWTNSTSVQNLNAAIGWGGAYLGLDGSLTNAAGVAINWAEQTGTSALTNLSNGNGSALTGIPESGVTSLVSDLASKTATNDPRALTLTGPVNAGSMVVSNTFTSEQTNGGFQFLGYVNPTYSGNLNTTWRWGANPSLPDWTLDYYLNGSFSGTRLMQTPEGPLVAITFCDAQAGSMPGSNVLYSPLIATNVNNVIAGTLLNTNSQKAYWGTGNSTNVTIDGGAGTVKATTFIGALNGNATTATTATYVTGNGAALTNGIASQFGSQVQGLSGLTNGSGTTITNWTTGPALNLSTNMGGNLTNLNAGALTGYVYTVNYPATAFWPADTATGFTVPALYTNASAGFGYSTNIQSSATESLIAYSVSQTASNRWKLIDEIPQYYGGGAITCAVYVVSGTNQALKVTNVWATAACTLDAAYGTAQIQTNNLPITTSYCETNWTWPNGITIGGTPKPKKMFLLKLENWGGSGYWTGTNNSFLVGFSITWPLTNAPLNGQVVP